MSGRGLVISLKRRKIPASAGNKALNLHHLLKHKRVVPDTFVCTWRAFERYQRNDLSLIEDLKSELAPVIQPGKSYAIRSSANVEDSLDRSFAGQFKSLLNINSVDDVIMAIWSVWSSSDTSNVKVYQQAQNFPEDQLMMAVIIQEMVPAVFSGVALSKNPVTGADEIIFEAVQGQGEQLVQGGVTPLRWVNKWGSWLEKPDDDQFPISLGEQIVEETRQISNSMGYPVDLEWVYDGSQLYWVQVREISALTQDNIYSNHISREFVPGMIKPLIYSVNIPLVNSVWIDWISEITGDLEIQPADLSKSFFYRVYFNMGILGKIFSGLGFPAESAEMLTGTLPADAAKPSFRPSLKTFSRLPWLLAFVIDKWTFGRKMKQAMLKLTPKVWSTEYQNLEGKSKRELLLVIDEHYELMEEVAYYNVLGPLLMGLYNNILARMLAQEGVEFNEFDLTAEMDSLQEYDPATGLEKLHLLYQSLPEEAQEKIRSHPFEELKNIPILKVFHQQFSQFLLQFGHLSDSGNDFSAVPWRETPELVLGLVASYEKRTRVQEKKIQYSQLDIPGLRRYMVRLIHHRARDFHLLREQVSHLYTFGYGLFRYYYFALGRIFVSEGIIDNQDDIFYLTDEEIRSITAGQSLQKTPQQLVDHRKQDMEKYQNINLPTVIFGEDLPLLDNISTQILIGVPTSGGTYQGKVRVVTGLSDMGKVQKGDVLVVPYSDVGWTPLFRQAGAVVAESGGLLSHSSIIAREYNIPAVVNVSGATNLADDTLVTVDGHQGKIFVHDIQEQPGDDRPGHD